MSVQKTKSANLTLVSAAALLDRDGRVLLTQRPEGKPLSGYWEFPGGKIEPGETPEMALRRELREELMIEPCERCFQSFAFSTARHENRHFLILLFVCRQWDGFVRAGESQEMTWCSVKELRNYSLLPADRYFADELNDRL